jgi:hypothetical protein
MGIIKTFTGEKATMYTARIFGITGYQVTMVAIGRMDYAQHKNCLYIEYKRKGSPRVLRMPITVYPYVFIISGWDAPKEPDWLVERGDNTSVPKYPSCDERYKLDFDEFINAQIMSIETDVADRVLVDIRHTINTSHFRGMKNE